MPEEITYTLLKKADAHCPLDFKPIACLPTIYRLLTAVISDRVYAPCEYWVVPEVIADFFIQIKHIFFLIQAFQLSMLFVVVHHAWTMLVFERRYCKQSIFHHL